MPPGVEWCETETRWEAKTRALGRAAAGTCPTQGTCDVPSERDLWIPGAETDIVPLRIKFNVFRNDDGSNPAATQAGVDAQVAQLNADYAPLKIQFLAETEFINDSAYRRFADSEEAAMKNTYADSPATQLNVYVVDIQAGYLGVGTFPWDPTATGNGGGLIIDNNWFGAPQGGVGQKTLTHEVGHCLGLWHTHHGVSEVAACSACWEQADGVEGDTTGDFASDTAPTPTNFSCGPPGDNDPCSATPWGATDPQNYMGYAPDDCYTEFSPQQWGRQHCWLHAALAGWIYSCSEDADCDDGRFCTGIETCVTGSCESGLPPSCDDLVDCTGDSCDPATDSCVHATDPFVYGASNVNINIPDNGGLPSRAVHTLNVPDVVPIDDVEILVDIDHTWVGDLRIEIEHADVIVVVMDRPGVPDTAFGCDQNNLVNVVFDDEGAGSPIENQCRADVTSPPSYLPQAALSAFDGLEAAGDWTIRVSDHAVQDVGVLVSWAVHLRSPLLVPPECGVPLPAQAEPGGQAKNRFISFVIPEAAEQETAIRVRLDWLHHPAAPPNAPDFTAYEGEYRYVNAFRDTKDNAVFDCPDSVALGSTFKCARLGCVPEYRDWNTDLAGETLHVTGAAVVPSSQYKIARLGAECAGQDESCFFSSGALTVFTAVWGDLLPGTLNAIDVGAAVDKAKDLTSAISEPRSMLQPHVPAPLGSAVSAVDIGMVVDAVKGQAYPFAGPGPCP
jgi:subtilisin-like proprotein convertase family protein